MIILHFQNIGVDHYGDPKKKSFEYKHSQMFKKVKFIFLDEKV